jgi:hypothetical protein
VRTRRGRRRKEEGGGALVFFFFLGKRQSDAERASKSRAHFEQ